MQRIETDWWVSDATGRTTIICATEADAYVTATELTRKTGAPAIIRVWDGHVMRDLDTIQPPPDRLAP